MLFHTRYFYHCSFIFGGTNELRTILLYTAKYKSYNLKNNIFLRSDNDKIKTNLNINNSSSLATFSKLRDLKDNF